MLLELRGSRLQRGRIRSLDERTPDTIYFAGLLRERKSRGMKTTVSRRPNCTERAVAP